MIKILPLSLLTVLFATFSVSFLIAQNTKKDSEIQQIATMLIAERKFKEAGKFLDSILAFQPNEIDAIAMKGNLVLNRAWMNSSAVPVDLKSEESIYRQSVRKSSVAVVIIAKETAKTIEDYWKRCLELDSTRLDIHKGLCFLYSISMQKQELMDHIVVLNQYLDNKNPSTAFQLCQYAGNIRDRGKFEDAIEVYRFISNLYPNVGGIYGDMAGEYFRKSDMIHALNLLDTAFTKPNLDAETYLNAGIIYSILGEYSHAQSSYDMYCKMIPSHLDIFYRSMLLFSVKSPLFQTKNRDFQLVADTGSEKTEIWLGKQLALLDTALTMEKYESFLANNRIPEKYLLLIHERAMTQFSTNPVPYLNYADLQSQYENYKGAIDAYSKIDSLNLTPDDMESYYFKFAFSLYKMGNSERASHYWQKLLSSEDFFRKSACAYFLGSYLVDKGEKQKAKAVLASVAGEPGRSKYAQLCSILLKAINE